MVQISMSLKEYYDNIYSNMSMFTETWGWFIDIDISTNNNTNNNNYKNTNININKILFNNNKLQNYRNTVKQLYNNITINNNIKNDNYRVSKKPITSRPSMSSRLSDLELQFKMDEYNEYNEYNEKEIAENSIYNKLLQGFCFIVILGLIVG